MDNFMLERLDHVKEENFIRLLGGSYVFLLQNKSTCQLMTSETSYTSICDCLSLLFHLALEQ